MSHQQRRSRREDGPDRVSNNRRRTNRKRNRRRRDDAAVAIPPPMTNDELELFLWNEELDDIFDLEDGLDDTNLSDSGFDVFEH